MTVKELAPALGLEIVSGGESLQREVTGGYCGDLLSWVMGRAKSGDAWLTVMGNVNAVAVASLADTACMVLCEGAQPDAQAAQKAAENDIAVLRSARPAYELALEIGRIIEKEKE